MLISVIIKIAVRYDRVRYCRGLNFFRGGGIVVIGRFDVGELVVGIKHNQSPADGKFRFMGLFVEKRDVSAFSGAEEAAVVKAESERGIDGDAGGSFGNRHVRERAEALPPFAKVKGGSRQGTVDGGCQAVMDFDFGETEVVTAVGHVGALDAIADTDKFVFGLGAAGEVEHSGMEEM